MVLVVMVSRLVAVLRRASFVDVMCRCMMSVLNLHLKLLVPVCPPVACAVLLLPVLCGWYRYEDESSRVLNEGVTLSYYSHKDHGFL